MSLTGIEGESIFINLLKPSSFSPLLAMVGVSLILFAKSTKKKDVGTILAGFAILMTGMDTMSGAVKPLADVEEFTSSYPEFISFCWYFAGTLPDRGCSLFLCTPDYYGAEYRNLCDGVAVRNWCK